MKSPAPKEMGSMEQVMVGMVVQQVTQKVSHLVTEQVTQLIQSTINSELVAKVSESCAEVTRPICYLRICVNVPKWYIFFN